MIKRILKTTVLVLVVTFLVAVSLSFYQSIRIRITYQEELHEYGKTREVQGLQVYYRETGESLPNTLVMVHGFMGNSYAFMNLFEALKSEYHLISVDLIGYGFSQKPTDFTYSKSNQAELVASLLQAINITHYDLLGHSMGGEVALHMAQLYPSQVNRLILVDAAIEAAPPQARLPTIFYDAIFKNYYFQKIMFRSSCHIWDDEKFDRFFDQMYYQNDQIPSRVLQHFVSDSDSGILLEELSSILTPTLLIWGEEDTWVPLSSGEKIDEGLPNSTLEVIPNAGHLVYMEQEDQFLVTLREYLLAS